MSKLARVYVTKYVLSTGEIEVVDAYVDDDMSAVEDDPSGRWPRHFYRNDFHMTADAAIADAERRRTAKIASVKRQLAKLEAMKFTAPASAEPVED